jgi:hypothetical protein
VWSGIVGGEGSLGDLDEDDEFFQEKMELLSSELERHFEQADKLT